MTDHQGPAARAAHHPANAGARYDPDTRTAVHSYPTERVITITSTMQTGDECLSQFTPEQGRILAAAIVRACEMAEGTTP